MPTTGVSWYGTGPNGSYTNAMGGCTDSAGNYSKLDGDSTAFAELGNGFALGHLPCGSAIELTINGVTRTIYKRDSGQGGIPVKGHDRGIDLWVDTAKAFGLNLGDGVWLGDWKVANGKVASKSSNSAHATPTGNPSTPDSGGLIGSIVSQVMETSLSTAMGIPNGDSVQSYMESFVYRSVEFFGGCIIIAAGLVLFVKVLNPPAVPGAGAAKSTAKKHTKEMAKKVVIKLAEAAVVA